MATRPCSAVTSMKSPSERFDASNTFFGMTICRRWPIRVTTEILVSLPGGVVFGGIHSAYLPCRRCQAAVLEGVSTGFERAGPVQESTTLRRVERGKHPSTMHAESREGDVLFSSRRVPERVLRGPQTRVEHLGARSAGPDLVGAGPEVLETSTRAAGAGMPIGSRTMPEIWPVVVVRFRLIEPWAYKPRVCDMGASAFSLFLKFFSSNRDDAGSYRHDRSMARVSQKWTTFHCLKNTRNLPSAPAPPVPHFAR